MRFTKPDGRGSNLGLGKYPEVSLLEARKLAAEFRKLRAQGKDLAVEHKKRS
ncbi:Arm DNA-binding domain-containing protein [Vibrio harveyi]|nr:Arm DNA-binding domain-containing protein [Vibrio harveyi]